MVIPSTIQELSEIVSAEAHIKAVGANTKRAWRAAHDGMTVSMTALTGVVEFTPADQVVVVRAGTLIADLNSVLAPEGQCIPLVGRDAEGTVGGSLSMNLPLALEFECGSWRDWVLGMTVVQADGTIAKAGSRAVKSVAGYDVHKFMVGARGTLAVVAEVILRTWPLKSLPKPNTVLHAGTEGAGCYQRVLPTDFEEAKLMNKGKGFDISGTCTLYREGIGMQRFPGDWILEQGGPLPANDFAKRAKHLFDPSNKLNPGELAD